MNTEHLAPDHADRLVQLDWKGPFVVTPDGLAARDDWRQPDLSAVLGGPGVYYVRSDHLIYGPRALLYIGRSDDLCRRLDQHDKWLQREWNVEVYVARVSADAVGDVERLLVWSHTPAANSSHVASSDVQALRIWNLGTCPGLLPDVSARHPWFTPSRERRR